MRGFLSLVHVGFLPRAQAGILPLRLRTRGVLSMMIHWHPLLDHYTSVLQKFS
jgi:hypothetical protein